VKGLDNINVRRAFAWAIDKRAITENILKDGSQPADWIIPLQLAIGPTGHDFRADVQEVYPGYDPLRAREAWETAKQELGVDSLTFNLMIEDNNATIKMAQSIQADLVKNLPGLTINLEQMPRVTRLDKERNHDYDLTLTRWGADYADPMTFLDLWLTDSSNNNGSWSNAAYDAQIISAQRGELAKDPALRWTALQAAEKTIMDEQVVIPLYQQGRAMMIQTYVHGFVYHSAGIGRVYTEVSKGP
jgi:oligopeptide transport system substrate-binding protein